VGLQATGTCGCALSSLHAGGWKLSVLLLSAGQRLVPHTERTQSVAAGEQPIESAPFLGGLLPSSLRRPSASALSSPRPAPLPRRRHQLLSCAHALRSRSLSTAEAPVRPPADDAVSGGDARAVYIAKLRKEAASAPPALSTAQSSGLPRPPVFARRLSPHA